MTAATDHPAPAAPAARRTYRIPTRALGVASVAGFVLLAVLLVVLFVTEENLAGTLAGVTGIVTGIVLGMWLVRTEPEQGDAPGATQPPSATAAQPPAMASAAGTETEAGPDRGDAGEESVTP
jgi:hypothetical protein